MALGYLMISIKKLGFEPNKLNKSHNEYRHARVNGLKEIQEKLKKIEICKL